LHKDIEGHTKAAEVYYQTVMAIKEKGAETLEAAVEDKRDLEKLEAHME
jgi:hypothetical protein